MDDDRQAEDRPRHWTVRAAVACCLTVSAGGAAWVAVWTGSALRTHLEYRLPLTGPVFFLTAGLVPLGLLAMWSLRMWRGSALATRWVRAFLVVLALLLIGSGLIPRTAWAALVVFVVAGVLVRLVGKAASRLADVESPVRPVARGDTEAAAAQRPYPYSAPLAHELKHRHLTAVKAWRRRYIGWAAVLMIGVISVTTLLLAPWTWSDDYALAALLQVGGTLATVVGAFRAVDPARRMYRHMALLRAYGVRLNEKGEAEDPPMPMFY